MVVYLILYFWFLRSKLSLPPQSLSEYIPVASPIVGQSGSQSVSAPDESRPFYYQNRRLKMVEGSYQQVRLGESLLVVRIGSEDKSFSLTKDTKIVCQPTGFLNIETSLGQAVAADKVFIEDKRDGNFGIPWGVEISTADISRRVTPETKVQLFAYDEIGSIIPIPKLAYAWFEKCL